MRFAAGKNKKHCRTFNFVCRWLYMHHASVMSPSVCTIGAHVEPRRGNNPPHPPCTCSSRSPLSLCSQPRRPQSVCPLPAPWLSTTLSCPVAWLLDTLMAACSCRTLPSPPGASSAPRITRVRSCQRHRYCACRPLRFSLCRCCCTHRSHGRGTRGRAPPPLC